MLNTFKVGENFRVVVSMDVMLLFSEELEYNSFLVLSTVALAFSVEC